MFKNTLYFIAILSFILFYSYCNEKPTEPQPVNPLDVQNEETGGDPFQLEAGIDNGGVTLKWYKLDIAALSGYVIYRSENDSNGFKKISNVTDQVLSYTDKSVENGHSYWYKVTAVNNFGYQNSQTNLVSVRIDISPYFIINGDEKYSKNNVVNLTILATTAQQMWVSNDAYFTDGNWEKYQTSKSWTLPPGDGPKHVYLKIKYNNDVEHIVSDEIILDTIGPVADVKIMPQSGITNETNFIFDASACSDNWVLAESLLVRWDWENDGDFDTDWSAIKIENYSYTVGGGDKTVVLQVKDGAGWLDTATTSIHVNTRPVAHFKFMKDNLTGGKINYDASLSSDYEDGANLECRWDFDGNGVYDTDWSDQKIISYTFEDYPTINTKLEVKDQEGVTNTMALELVINTGSVTDIDGKVYRTIKIGDQVWMAENLKVTHYRDGSPIYNPDNMMDWYEAREIGAWLDYRFDKNKGVIYGHLYNSPAVLDSRKIAPEGWHVASDNDWKLLEMALGMSKSQADANGDRGTNEGSKLAGNADLWKDGALVNNAAFGESGFCVLPGGANLLLGYGEFCYLGSMAWFWTSSGGYDTIGRFFDCSVSTVYRRKGYLGEGCSVRCVRD